MNTETPPLHETAPETFCRLLENFAFMFADPTDGGTPADGDEDLMCTEITFSGAASGKLSLAATLRFAIALASNALGVDPEDDAAKQDAGDALKELLNLYCGHFITDTLGRTDGLVEISPPSLGTLNLAQWDALSTMGDTMRFMVDSEHFLLLRYDRDAA